MGRLTYGRKFRDKSGRLGRYVYKHRKKIGFVVLVAADLALPDTEAELNRSHKRSSRSLGNRRTRTVVFRQK